MFPQACILLMRHGKKKAVGTHLSTQEKSMNLTPIGLDMTRDAGLALAEEARKGTGGTPFEVCLVWHSSAVHAKETADLLCKILGAQNVADANLQATENPNLDPDHLWDFKRKRNSNKDSDPQSSTTKIIDDLFKELKSLKDGSIPAIVIVGHEPQMGWIASELLGDDVPLSHSEIACIGLPNFDRKSRHRNRKLLWIISPSEPSPGWESETKAAYGDSITKISAVNVDSAGKIVSDLREKIKSKMDTAKLLGTGLTAAIAWIMSSFLDRDKFAKLGCWAQYEAAAAILLLLSSLVLFMRAMYSYDSLLMPVRFWGSGKPKSKDLPRWLVARPPSPASWVLYQNMMHVWSYQFTPAIWAGALGLAALATATLTNWGTLRLQDYAFGAILGVSVVAILAFCKWGGVRLGVQD
jgi:phosphohistidine phosphatase SixA